MANFDGTDDYFDSREVIERIAELESELEDLDTDTDYDQIIELRDELAPLIALQEEAEGNIPDWEYGETFISEDTFTEHMMEILVDVGYLPADLPGFIEIDREATADNMKEDYTEFEFQGTTYYAR